MVKDGAKTIRRCLDSVMALNWPNCEHVIQDGASTDGTLEILQEYSRRFPGKIKLLSERDSCAEEGFFRGLKRCQGELIGSCLADEALLPQAGEWAVAAFRQHPAAGAVYGDLYITDVQGKIQSEFKAPHQYSLEKYLLHEVNPPFASTFFRRDALEDIGLKSHSWLYDMGEFELWVRLSFKYSVYYVPGVVATYAVHSTQLSANKNALLKSLENRISYLNSLLNNAHHLKFNSDRDQILAGLHLFFAEILVRDSCAYLEAGNIFHKALRLRPNKQSLVRVINTFINHGFTLIRENNFTDAIICLEPLSNIGLKINKLDEVKRCLATQKHHLSNWKIGLNHEISFWKEWIIKLANDRSITDRLDEKMPLQPSLCKLLTQSFSTSANFIYHLLDLGSGPLTSLGKVYNNHNIQITATDPLANFYLKILDDVNVIPLVRPVEIASENLTQIFNESSFELVTGINSLDHSHNPLEAIIQAIKVVKPGCYILLANERNEGVNEGYVGLHQWNFDVVNNDFIIWNPTVRWNVSKKLNPIVSIICEITKDREFVDSNDVLVVKIHKRIKPDTAIKEQPLVSIIVVTHNYSNHLTDVVACLLNQTYENLEIIIIDDGSSDESLSVATNLSNKYEYVLPIRVYRLNNVGPSAARNFGVQHCNGKYFLPLDADDRIASTYIEKTVPVLEADDKLGFVYVDQLYFGDTNKYHNLPEYDFEKLCNNNYIGYCSLIRREAFDQVGGYDSENWGYYEDWDLWIRLGLAARSGKHLAELLFFYNHHSSSSLSLYSLRLDPIYRAYLICKRPKLYAESVVSNSKLLLSEIYDGWNSNPPLQGIDQIQDLLSRYPGNRHLLYYLAVEQRNAGKYYDAIANLDILIIKYPADQQARSLLTDTINKNL